MKRVLLLLLSLSLLLSSCGFLGDTPPSVTSEATTAPTEAPTEPVKESSLLDAREAFDNTGSLWYIPNAEIESQPHPTLHAFAGNLLLTTTEFISDGKIDLTLTVLSAENGEPVHKLSLSVADSLEPQILGNKIAVCDNYSGAVILLDETLQEIKRYTLTPDTDAWYLGADLDTLYKCGYFSGVRVCSLSTGKERSAFDLTEVSASGFRLGTDISFTCVDLQTQRNACFCLDLSSGERINPPFAGDFAYAYRNGNTWLASLYESNDTYFFGADDSPSVLTAQDGTFSMLDPQGHLLFTGFDGTLKLFDTDGSFLSTCALPRLYVSSIIWQEALGGYLLLVNSGENRTQLLFWDIAASTQGKDLAMQSLADYRALPGGTSADRSLYERAQALSERYGIELRIADQCETEFAYFTCYQLSDYATITSGLDILEKALSVYPDGFFRQLAYGHYDHIQFQLVGGLIATNGFGGDGSYAAFTEPSGSVFRIVLDINTIDMCSIWHELSHVIDKHLAWDAAYREDALFSEETWLSLQPDGFSYSEDYGVWRTDIQAEWYSYFVDDYAMINATEDRARTLESAMDRTSLIFTYAPKLLPKLQYYCDCIRDCFDTTLWPETTAWEAPLHEFE